MNEQSKKFLVKYAAVILTIVSLFAVSYGVYAGLSSYSLLTSPLINTSPGLAVVQSLFAGFFSAVVAFFVGGIFSVVLSVFAAFGVAVLFGGKKSGEDNAGETKTKEGKEEGGK